jgi:hypothetical protein
VRSSISNRNFVVLCNPENRRLGLFQSALARFGLPPAEVVAYREFLKKTGDLRSAVASGCVLRIESPGENFEVEKALLALGADAEDGGSPVPRLTRTQVGKLSLDKGRIRHTAQWFFGFRTALERVKAQLSDLGTVEAMNAPEDILTMFDKRVCHGALDTAGMAVPPALPPVSCFEEMLQSMAARGWSRVFIKPTYGSSASGVIAFARHRHQMVAYTSVEVVPTAGAAKLYNSLRLRRYEDPDEIRLVVDTLCRDRVHVEKWIPKASVRGESFDLRVVVIGRKATHTVVRMSQSPITNLHLGNKRGHVTAVQECMGQEKWAEAMKSCECALEAMPNSHYAGIDLAIEAGFQNHAILEMNAFGDLLPNVLSDGLDTYSTEVANFCTIEKALLA